MNLNELIDQIEEAARIRMAEEGIADADWDEFEERYFFAELEWRINNHEPGWELLQNEYFPEFK